jgi:hypothetical protein
MGDAPATRRNHPKKKDPSQRLCQARFGLAASPDGQFAEDPDGLWRALL